MVRRGKHREPRVREQVLHLHGMLDTDDVAIAHSRTSEGTAPTPAPVRRRYMIGNGAPE